MLLALPGAVSAFLVLLLGWYAWRRRSSPGALPFACMMLLALPWLLADAIEVSTANAALKVFCFRLQPPLEIAVFTAELLFALECGYPSWRPSRRALLLLAVPPVAALALTLTNPAHHLLWTELEVRRTVHPVHGTGVWALVAYAGVLSLVTASVFVSLLFRARRQWRPALLCLTAVVLVRIAWVADTTGVTHAGPLGHSTGRTAIATTFAFAMYAVALFWHRLLEIISVAREAVIEQIRDALVVVDTRGVIVDVNRAAEAAFAVGTSRLIGLDVAEVLPRCGVPMGTTGHYDLRLGGEGRGRARDYVVESNPLATARNVALGHVLLLHDVTEERRAQELLVDHQRALAASQERERMARELHDSLGQVLGYVKMQVQAARDLLASDRGEEANRYLAQAAEVAQDAHADVRDFILAARTGISPEIDLVAALERYVRQYGDRFGLKAELVVDAPFVASGLSPIQQMHLLRIVQEGLTNARKHANAAGTRVTLDVRDGCARATVEDDGVGFEAGVARGERDLRFGLAFMRERAEAAGGNVRVESTLGAGTRVVVSLPLHGGTQ